MGTSANPEPAQAGPEVYPEVMWVFLCNFVCASQTHTQNYTHFTT